MSLLDWLIVLFLNGGVIAWGFWLARSTRTAEEWFLASRHLPWWAVGLSMFATNLDNADLVSLTGAASREGMHLITVHAVGTVLGGILASFVVVPAMYRAGHYTNAEYLEARFGPASRLLSALIQIQYRTSMLGLMIWSVYLLLTGLVGLASPAAWTLIAVTVVLSALYTGWGGLRSVVWTDAAQGVILVAGASVIFAAVWRATGGWSEAVETLRALPASAELVVAPADLARVSGYRGTGGTTSPFVVALGWMIVAGGYWTVNHTQTMRLMGSRSLWDMRMAALLGTALSLPIALACIALGVMGRALFPDFSPADQLYPHLAAQYLGPGLRGLVVAALLAAAISTFDSMGSSLSALFTRDIYARFLARGRIDDRRSLAVSRVATVGILALGFLYLPFVRSKETMLSAFLTLIPVFVTPLFTLYLAGTLTRAHPRSGIIGLVAGSLYGIGAFLEREVFVTQALPGWLTERWFAYPWSMAVTAGAMALATAVLGRAQERGTVATSDGSAGAVRASPFPGERVPVWARPGWIAVLLTALSAYLVFGLLW